MSERTRLALMAVGAASALGVTGDLLFNVERLGLNAATGTALLALAMLLVARWGGIRMTGEGRWLLAPAVLFSLGFAWRDSPTLGLANAVAVLVSLALATMYSRSGTVVVASLASYVVAGLRFGTQPVIALLLLLGEDVKWAQIPRRGWGGQAMAIGRGVALALPLLLLFGALLASADAAFSGILRMLFDWDLREIVRHLFWTGLSLWATAGVLREALIVERRAGDYTETTKGWLGMVETATVLGSLDLLFLGFVLVQARYLFGGAALVEASVTLTYAEYARRGFFELVAVAAIALPLLLGMDAVAKRETSRQEIIFRSLAGGLVALLLVVVVSAVQRMRLYQEEFGQTELRLYTTAFMVWLAILLVWFAATVLRGQRRHFAFGTMLAGFLVIAGLNVLNPDALIVSTNVDRAAAGKQLDVSYFTRLSADAVPVLVESLPSLPEAERAQTDDALSRRWSSPPSADLRAWNWSRAQAHDAFRPGALQPPRPGGGYR